MEGRTIDVQPKPVTVGGPVIAYGGGSKVPPNALSWDDVLLQTTDPKMAATIKKLNVSELPGLTMGPAKELPPPCLLQKIWTKAGNNMACTCFMMLFHIEDGWENIITLRA